MRRLLALIAVLAAAPVAAQAANLLTNGDFEASTSNFTTPPGWYNIGHTEGVIAYDLVGMPDFDGEQMYVFGGVSVLMAIVMTFFELLVILLQAYVFTVLMGTYLNGSIEAEH